MGRRIVAASAVAAFVAGAVLVWNLPEAATPRASGSGSTAAGVTTSPPASASPVATGTVEAPVEPEAFFTPRRLAPGERPPQFVIVSFDGAGSHEKWRYWRQVADRAHLRFTGFLSGIYLVDKAHRSAYHGPGHRPGAASIGFPDTEEVPVLVDDLNTAWREGHEIGTHFNGHFCAGAGRSGAQWSSAEWSSELRQFFGFVRDYRTINGAPGWPALIVPPESITGGRTPCLEGDPAQLMPALRSFGFDYDSSGVRTGLAWPTRNQYGIWEFPMAYVPMPGRPGGVVSMDYNFWVKQTGNPPTTGNSAADSAQVLRTYRQMYQAAYTGNRAPLVLGNHFNSWNNNAYTQALTRFVTETCTRPDTYCVPYRDVIGWMRAQDPQVLSELQRRPPVDTP